MALVLVAVAACSDDGVPANDDASGDATATVSAGPTSAATDTDGGGSTGGSDSQGTTTVDPGSTMTTSATTEPTATADSSGSGTESTTGEPATACEDAAGCMLHDDCCNCIAITQGAEPPACDIPECDQSACGALGIDPQVQCELGSCEFVPLPCNPFEVACDSLPPECPDGTLPSVDPLASCWSGDCVPAAFCDVVPDCADCPDDEVCVQNISQIPTFTCSPIPAACDGTPSCACMGEVCVSPFDVCGDGDGTISCACPAC